MLALVRPQAGQGMPNIITLKHTEPVNFFNIKKLIVNRRIDR